MEQRAPHRRVAHVRRVLERRELGLRRKGVLLEPIEQLKVVTEAGEGELWRVRVRVDKAGHEEGARWQRHHAHTCQRLASAAGKLERRIQTERLRVAALDKGDAASRIDAHDCVSQDAQRRARRAVDDGAA